MATGKNKHDETIELIDDEMPNLRSFTVDWDRASDPSEDYNCLGLAVGSLKWWSPPNAPGVVRNPRDYWPPFVTDDNLLIETYAEAAETLGFRDCPNSSWEEGFEKIVLFHSANEFTHAAVQVGPDLWKSKFGNLSDIDHTLHELADCKPYGHGRHYMKRRRPKTF